MSWNCRRVRTASMGSMSNAQRDYFRITPALASEVALRARI
jgi:hypothetical protein